MKKFLFRNALNKYIFLFVLVIFFVTGCSKKSLDVTDEAAITPEATWSSSTTADLFLNDMYTQLPDLYGYFCFDPLENWSDNAMAGFGWSLSGQVTRNMPTVTPSTDLVQWYGGGSTYWDNWTALYSAVRKCNVFIKNVSASTTLPQSYKDQRLGEAHTLRAYFYQLLWMSFGGVPIITSPDEQTTEGQAIFHPRASSDDTYSFIVSDLDSAIATLPTNSGNDGTGHITKGAALTIKGWVQLVYASPLHNPSNDPSRWAAAAATNKQVMQMGYSLDPNYAGMFMGAQNNDPEAIFYREYLGNVMGSFLTQFQGPSHVGWPQATWESWSGSTPTQQLVDAYSMANGKPITDPTSGYDPNNPYANREPRFYASICYNGSTYNGQPFYSYDGLYQGQVANNPIDLSDATDYTNTGYGTKKRIDTTVNIFTYGASSQTAFLFRYAEVLLNYAEAENEAVGPDATVYAALDQIRTRAGISTASAIFPGLSQADMRTLIHRERRVELAFEDKRYWDLLRWKEAETKLNQTMNAMFINWTNGHWTYQVQPAARGQHTFDPSKNYVLPIPQAAMEQNPKLVQNPGY